jgi:hypothetical protein
MLRCPRLPWRSPSLHTDAAGSAPDAFGPFRILHQIGAGTLGPVFRAFDPESDRLVAVKVFTIDLAPERVHQVVAELQRLQGPSLAHPAIAAPLAAGIHDNHPYLVLEYASADSLDVVVRHGAASPADSLRVAAQLAGALDFAAVDDILHGALHPRDVLIMPEDTKLTGLGVARAFERVGVPAPIRRPYTPPECIGAGAWDRRADVFSLAAVMHELMWGRRLSSMGEQASATLTPLEGADLAALRVVFGRGLAEDPADRFETALEFAEGLKLAFPKVVLASPKRRTPRAPVRVEPRLPLGEADDETEPVSGHLHAAAAVPDELRDGPEHSRLPPTPVEIVMGQPGEVAELPMREAGPDLAGVDEVLEHPEPPRFGDVEPEQQRAVGAAVPAALLSSPHPLVGQPALMDAPGDAAAPALDSTRSAVWPLALALVVGAAIGFGGGYFFAHYERTSAPEAGVQAEAPVPASAPAPVTPPPAAGAATPEVSTARPPAPPPAAGEPAAERPAPPQAAGGRLLVRSTPAGARVFVDGREQGRTPLTVDDLARGVHRVRVVREGYATEERRITITGARPTQSITVPLARPGAAQAPVPSAPAADAAGSGRVTVVSRPAGARVFVDGKLLGTTPLQVPQVAAGTHTVRLELEGYRPWISTVQVAAGEHRVAASLDR